MYLKRNLMYSIRSLGFQLKGIGVFIWVPLLVMYVIFPSIHIIAYQMPIIENTTAESQLYDSILRMTQYFIPLLSVWWPIFVLEHNIEEPMHELLYLKSRIKLGNLMLLYIGFLICMVPLFLVYTRFFPSFWWLFLKLAILNFFYLASVYAVAYLFEKIIFAAGLVFFYTIFVITQSMTKTILLDLILMKGRELFEGMWGFIVVALVLLCIGGIANYYFPEKNNS